MAVRGFPLSILGLVDALIILSDIAYENSDVVKKA